MTDLTAAAREGFYTIGTTDGEPKRCPYLATSPNAYAWLVGRHMGRHGNSEPMRVRMGRGSKVRVASMMFAVDDNGTVSRVS